LVLVHNTAPVGVVVVVGGRKTTSHGSGASTSYSCSEGIGGLSDWSPLLSAFSLLKIQKGKCNKKMLYVGICHVCADALDSTHVAHAAALHPTILTSGPVQAHQTCIHTTTRGCSGIP
jgi:hypothetical protein